MSVKNAKRNYVIERATDLFLEQSLSSVTIRDIAQSSGVGEATVYRYFSGRTELVIACAIKLQREVERYFADPADTHTGYERISRFYRAYLDLFRRRPRLYRCLNEFDAYCVNEGVTGLDEYADNMDRFRDVFLAAYREGVNDQTIRTIDALDTFYYATTHAILSLCKKLAAGDDILRQDKLTDKSMEVETLIEVILSYLKRDK